MYQCARNKTKENYQMKIGLVTIYHVPNYGSVLQTYATQMILEKMGHECVVIRYNYRNDYFFAKQGQKRDKFKEWQLDNIPFLKSGKLNKFRKEHLNFSKKFDTYEELEQYDWTSFDCFIVGSDQVWNTKYLHGNPAFLLKFVPDNKPRISFSSSFATNGLPEEFRDLFTNELKKFKVLSVRESNGVDIIQRSLGINKDVQITLDPTLLLSKEDWLKNITRSPIRKKRPYILLYMWTYAFEPRPYILRVVEHFQKIMSADVRVLEGHRELKDLQCSYIDENKACVGRFIELFANADLVITSSFHGTAFAVNFGIPLISIVPNGESDDRQSSLLTRLALRNCIVHIGDDVSTINPKYDLESAQRRLSAIRNSDINWLFRILQV